jgi:hypothetical protein
MQHSSVPHFTDRTYSLRCFRDVQGAGAQGGWSGYPSDRPKSANFTGSSGAGANNAGLMASLTGGGRPSSSQQQPALSSWGAQQQQMQAGAGAGIGAANANTLSYGSLKNRFLSGNPKPVSAAPQPAPIASNMGGNGAKPNSKLFSLAR